MAKNKKENSFSVRKLFYNDKYLIVFSVIAAVIIWIVTSMSLSPETTKTITVPVPVDFTNSAAEKLGMKCFGEEKIDVDVTIKCKKYLAKDITADDINASLQTNTVTAKGVQEVPVKIDVGENADFSVVSFYPSVYEGYFDIEDEKVFDISVSYANKDFIQEGYIMGDALLSESSVIVKGPKSFVSQVDKVVSTVNIDEKINKTETLDLSLSAVDSTGTAVDYITLDTGSKNLSLTIPVLKKVNLDVSASFVGKPENLDISKLGVTYSVQKLNAGVLEDVNLDSANVGNINFSQLSPGINTFKFDVTALDGVIILDDIDEVAVTVEVPKNAFDSKKVSVSNNAVKITNIPDGYKAEVVSLSSSNVTVVGPVSDVKKIKEADIQFVADLSAYKNDGKTERNEFKITAPSAFSKTCWISGDYTAVIKIVKK